MSFMFLVNIDSSRTRLIFVVINLPAGGIFSGLSYSCSTGTSNMMWPLNMHHNATYTRYMYI